MTYIGIFSPSAKPVLLDRALFSDPVTHIYIYTQWICSTLSRNLAVYR